MIEQFHQRCVKGFKGLGHAVLGNFQLILQIASSKVKLAEQESFICKITDFPAV